MSKFDLEDLAFKHFNTDFNTAVDNIAQEYLDPKTGMLQKKLKPHLVAYYISCDMIDIAIHHPNEYDLDIQELLGKIETKTKTYFYNTYVPKVEEETTEEELDF